MVLEDAIDRRREGWPRRVPGRPYRGPELGLEAGMEAAGPRAGLIAGLRPPR